MNEFNFEDCKSKVRDKKEFKTRMFQRQLEDSLSSLYI